jgi:probable phosphoglycerate mutase
MNRRVLLSTGTAAVLGAGFGNVMRAAAQATPATDANPEFRVLFIRHAESQINELRAIEIPGQPLPPDSGVSYPLTQEGTHQAIALAEQLRAVELQAIYASTRLRALQTADAIAFAHAMTIELAPEIVEVAFTDPAASMSTVDAPKAIEAMADWVTGNPEAKAPGGESLNDVLARFLPFVEETIIAHAADAGSLVLVSHSITLGAALPYLFSNLSPAWAMAHVLRNTGIVTGAYVDGRLVCLDWQGEPPQ